jgi:preprotein translocase subunit YajC
MTIRKSAAKAATPAAATSVAIVQPEYNRSDMIKRLADADAKQRIVLLSGLVMGEVAALGGIVGTIAASVNEVLAVKMAGLHGNDWVAIAKAMPSDLCDADKTRRKAILASLESIRETVKANSGGNADKARDVLRRVKEWGEGKRTNKASKPKGNTKMAIDKFLLDWPTLPSIYRRLMKDEGTGDNELALGDAIAAYFTAKKINPRAVLDCSGESAWNK